MARSFGWSSLILVIALAGAAKGQGSAPAGRGKSLGWNLLMTEPGEPGDALVIEGRVLGPRGRPMRDALIRIYHADARDIYSNGGETNPRLDGMLRTNVLGGFRIRTVLPGLAEGAAHAHFELVGPVSEYRATSLNFSRLTGAGTDSAFARLPQMLTLPSGTWAYVRRDMAGAFQCRWDLDFTKR